MNTNIIELKKGLNTAFIDATENSNLAYRPQFVYNDNEKGQKVFSAIEDELRHCDEFAISVAFINFLLFATPSTTATIIQTRIRNIRG